MPIENERKYVLGDPQAVHADMLAGKPYAPGYYGTGWRIKQGYLPGGARVRAQTVITDLPRFDVPLCVFTYKIKAGDKLVEIEKTIEPADFDLLWPLTTDRVDKIRFPHVHPQDEDDVAWDIDLFLDDTGAFYYAMAECEMAPSKRKPKSILPVLVPHLVYEVPPKRAEEFTNVKLSDPAYARSLKLG